jgi:PhzF family phenazine biosynthesis protein
MKIFQVDAFADGPFTGNPAAVCLLDYMPDDAWLQGVALDMNLSETAFLLKQENGWRLRWFTPALEVDLCGHATLASSHILFSYGYEPAGATIRFHTRSGELQVTKQGEWLQMNFPAENPTSSPAPDGLLDALGCEASFVGKNRMDYLVEVENEEILLSLNPDYRTIRQIPVRGIIVTCRAGEDKDYDFASRFFAPAAGVDEDPVTGSAHCCLAPYWAEKLGRSSLTGFQASARGGMVKMTLVGNRVLLGGQAVTVMEGKLLV